MEYKTIIGAKSLTKKFNKFTALNSITFNISEPCIVGLIGNNGAGKTTLLKILNTVYDATSGEAVVLDKDPHDVNALSNCILVDDTMAYPPHYKLKDILKEMPEYFPFWDADKADKLMEHFKLPYNRSFNKLSKGMKNIFNAIIGLSANVAVTLMDEPTTGMDASARKDFYDIVLNEFMTSPRLILLSSHLIGEMEKILSHAIVIKSGETVFVGETTELTSNAYRIYGDEKAIEPLLTNARVFGTKDVFGKVQCDLMAEFNENDFAYMDANGIERANLGLNETCIYLCADKRSNINDIYGDSDSGGLM